VIILDLTLPLSTDDPPFTDPTGYSDPPTRIEPWITIGEQRGAWTSPFHVSHLHLSAHAGTHLDAPSHFQSGAPTMSYLPSEALVGRAVVVDLRDTAKLVERLRKARERASKPEVTPLILTPPAWLTPAAVDEIIVWDRPLIAFAGETDSDEGYVAVSRLLAAGHWMASNLDPEKATQVQDGDLLVIAPLALSGLEGSPCRVLAVRS
jgi:kynurenine formamidase